MSETGKYTFRWEHPAEEVLVTGTFDDWSKSIQLEKNADGVFEKTVELPIPKEPVYYKFVKDSEWVTSHTAPTETDSSGNTNNVLRPSDFISSAAPNSSTAAMAANVPLESDKNVSVNPIPASEGPGNPVSLKPGEKVPAPETINSNTITSGVYDDPELKAADEAKTKSAESTFGVAPIPATEGLGNPVTLAPGEPVPPASQLTSNTVNSTATTDKASYENSGALPSSSLPASTGADASTIPAAGAGSGVKIPESGGIPMGADAPSAKDADASVFTQSAGPNATTAGLAAQQPIIPRSSGVPEVVKESQKEAHVDPEAAANPEAVKEKKEVEKELLKDVKTTDATGEPAPTVAAATSSEAPKATGDTLTAPVEKKRAESRDVSPKTDPANPRKPEAPQGKKDESKISRRMSAAFRKATGGGAESSSKTAGTGAATTTTTTTTPAATETKTDKKSKRKSIMVKIKEAFK